MTNLSDRIRRLEARAADTAAESLNDRERKQLEKWPEIILDRYCDNRLDQLASTPSLPILKLLQALEREGYAIELGGQWHPLFTANDPEINAQVIARLEAFGEEEIGAALDARRQPA